MNGLYFMRDCKGFPRNVRLARLGRILATFGKVVCAGVLLMLVAYGLGYGYALRVLSW